MRVIPFSVPISRDTVVTQEDHLPYFYNYFHHHKEIQITLILKGEGTLVVGNFSQPFREGDIYVIGSNQPHIFKSNQSHFEHVVRDRVHAFHIFMDVEKIDQFGLFPELNKIRSFLQKAEFGFQVPASSRDTIRASIEKIRQKTGLTRLLTFIGILQHFSEDMKGWKSLSSGLYEEAPVAMDGRMSLIYEYTMQHYRENITLEKIAQVSHMTPQAFCKYFKKHTSKTYIHFLQDIRVQEACSRIIKGTFESVSTLAYACGFNSPVNFHKVFKKCVGVSPSQYIRKHRLDDQRKSMLLAS